MIALCICELVKRRFELTKYLFCFVSIPRRYNEPYRRTDDRRGNLFLHLLDVCFVLLKLVRLGLLLFLFIFFWLTGKERLHHLARDFAKHGLGRTKRR